MPSLINIRNSGEARVNKWRGEIRAPRRSQKDRCDHLVRVVLDAYWWVDGPQSLKNVVHGLTEAWCEEFPGDEVTIVVRRKNTDLGALPANVNVARTSLWPQALSAMVAVPFFARRVRADAMLAHNFTPLLGKHRGVFVQDVMFESNPEWFTRKELLYFRWMSRTARRANVLFSSTNTEGLRLRKFTRAPRIVTAGLGLSPEIVGGVTGSPVAGLESGSFMLAVGRLNIRKNLANALEGARASGVLRRGHPLVIVGARDGEWNALPQWVREAEDVGEVVFTGFVDDNEMYWMVRNCSLHLSLSLDEGFGLPPVEAAVMGARVLVSDRAVFRETLGTSARFVDPLNPAAIGTVIREMLEEGGRASSGQAREKLIERHNWGRTVDIIRSGLMS